MLIRTSKKTASRLIIALMVAFAAPLASAVTLESSSAYKESEADISAIVDSLASLRTGVISGRDLPNWNDFNQLETLLSQILAVKDRFKDRPEAKAELESLAKELRAKALSDDRVREKFDARAAYTQGENYKPTEFELKTAYQMIIGRINRELPADLRIPIKRLPEDQRRPRLLKEAREYAAKSREVFVSRFSQSEYKSYEEFEKFLRSSTDPRVAKALTVVDHLQFRAVIRRPENARFWVPKTGFQNQFITGSSNGLNDPDFRNNAEAKLFGVEDKESYVLKDPEFKPKYGTFLVKPESVIPSGYEGSDQYGTDIYGLKFDRIADRLSFTPWDSLTNYAGDKWDQMVFPWSFRLLMVPFLLVGAAGGSDGYYPSGFNPPQADPLFPLKTQGWPHNYWEIQILGPVTLDDVDYFEFRDQPPSGEFLRELKMRHIPIFDGRHQPAKPWQEE